MDGEAGEVGRAIDLCGSLRVGREERRGERGAGPLGSGWTGGNLGRAQAEGKERGVRRKERGPGGLELPNWLGREMGRQMLGLFSFFLIFSCY